MQIKLHQGDVLTVLKSLPSQSVHCCVTSPPYYALRDYGVAGQIGLEATPEDYVARLVEVFAEVRRVLRDDGTLWLNLGDSYASTTKGSGGTGKNGLRRDGRREDVRVVSGDRSNMRASFSLRRFDLPEGLKPKDIIGIPWLVAFALRADGWYLRADVIWHKPNVMPSSVRDRPTLAHEHVFLLSKSARYYYDAGAIMEDAVTQVRGRKRVVQADRKELHGPTYSRHRSSVTGGQSLQASPNGKRNRRSVWVVPTQPCREAHFAIFPEKLIEPCILAGCPEGGTVLDPFVGSGTTCLVARRLDRHSIGIELNAEYVQLARKRLDLSSGERGI